MISRILCFCVVILLFTGLACDSKGKPAVEMDPKEKPAAGPKAPTLPKPPPPSAP